jgi:hypothetical protein
VEEKLFEPYIPEGKILNHLLKPLSRGDKSRFLAFGGFNKLTVNDLEAEILRLGKEGGATKIREHRFGKNVEIQGALRGPNGKELPVKTVWLVPKLRSPARFVTLVPDV